MALVTTFRIARCMASGSKVTWGDAGRGHPGHLGIGGPRLRQFDHVVDATGRMSAGTIPGSRSLLNESMSITRFEIFSWLRSTMPHPLETTSNSLPLSPSSIK